MIGHYPVAWVSITFRRRLLRYITTSDVGVYRSQRASIFRLREAALKSGDMMMRVYAMRFQMMQKVLLLYSSIGKKPPRLHTTARV